MLELSLFQIGAVLATYLFAAVAKGITGLGFTTTCLPILALIVGLKDAMPLVIVPSVCSNLIVMRQVGRFRETLHRFWPMFLALVPGLVLGLWVLAQIDSVQAGAVLGAMLILWCAFTFLKPDLRLPSGWEGSIAPFTGFTTGVINGVTGSQVMPAVPFLMMLNLDRNMFVQAMNCAFTLSSLVMAVGLGRLGLFSLEDLLVSSLGVTLIYMGLRIGAGIQSHLSETLFRNMVLLMLLVMGLGLFISLFA